MDYSNMKFEELHLNDINLNILRINSIYKERVHANIDSLKQEDSNSGNSIQMVSQIEDSYEPNRENCDTFKNKINSCGDNLSNIVEDSKQSFNSQANEKSLMIITPAEELFYDEKNEVHINEVHYAVKSCKNSDINNENSTELNHSEAKVLEKIDYEIDSSKNETKQKNSSKECKQCGKVYKTNYKLLQHMRKHSGEKPFNCSSCDKSFRSKIGLAQHEAKHTGKIWEYYSVWLIQCKYLVLSQMLKRANVHQFVST